MWLFPSISGSFSLFGGEILSYRKVCWGVLKVDYFQISSLPSGLDLHISKALQAKMEAFSPSWKRNPAEPPPGLSSPPDSIIIHNAAESTESRQTTGQRPWQMAAPLPSAGTEFRLTLRQIAYTNKKNGKKTFTTFRIFNQKIKTVSQRFSSKAISINERLFCCLHAAKTKLTKDLCAKLIFIVKINQAEINRSQHKMAMPVFFHLITFTVNHTYFHNYWTFSKACHGVRV